MEKEYLKSIAVMQPYFLPYLGYFQLMNAVNEFVIYDNLQFTKRGWIHRNRIMQNKQPAYISLPLKKDSDYLNINQRFLSDNFEVDKLKLLSKIKGAYQKAPQFKKVFPIIEEIFKYKDINLFNYVNNSIEVLKDFLNIDTKLIKSSEININHDLKSQDKVIAISQALNADVYINPEGGKELYSVEVFNNNNIKLKFHSYIPEPYHQFSEEFISHLSIIDVLMFNGKEECKNLLDNYKLE